MSQPLLLTTNIQRFARHRPLAVATIDDAGETTYEELWTAIEAVAAKLRHLGVQPGDRVATAMPPSTPHLVLLLGVMLAGAVGCPLNIRLTNAEFARFLEPIGASVIVCDEHHREVVEGLPGEIVVLPAIEASAPLRDRLSPLWDDASRTLPAIDEASPGLIIPTGGTTGIPKGAIFTHRGMWLWGASSSFNLSRAYFDRELALAPFFHIAVLTGPMSTLFTGGTVRILSTYSTERAIEEIDRGATMLSASVTIYKWLKEHPDFDRIDRSRMRLLSTGSMPSTAEFISGLRRDYPNARVRSTYAATEFGPVAALLNEQIDEGDFTSVGYPLPGVQIRVLDDHGHELPWGESGEIEVTSPWQTAGYWGRPEETAATYFPTGIRLGDSGFFRPDGRLVVNGRKKEMLISGGENVFPSEVEAVLSRHPEIADIAIFGIRDERWGDRIEAAAVRRPGSTLTHEQLVAFGRRSLGGYKLPKETMWIETIPVTSNNKPDRRKLTEWATERQLKREAT